MNEIVLQTHGLTKRFGRFTANADIDFSVPQGQLRAVIGPNGAGKTTFFNMLAGATSITAGSVCMHGKDITRLSGAQRVTGGIAKAFQTANVFAEQTVWQNCRLAALAHIQGTFAGEFFRRSHRFAEIDESAHEALHWLDLLGHIDTRAGDLSHGDKKRLDIAIALATEPEILLLDEPVAGMSLEEVRKTEVLIRKLAGQRTILLIEHDMDLVMGISDFVTVLHQGRILAEGTPAEIHRNSIVQEAYLGGHHPPETITV